MSDMTPTRIADLGPLRDNLQAEIDLKRAMEIVSPQHPNRSPKLILRAGRFQNGMYVYFQANIAEARNPNAWTHFRDMKDAEREGLLTLVKADVVAAGQGPACGALFYHESEGVLIFVRRT